MYERIVDALLTKLSHWPGVICWASCSASMNPKYKKVSTRANGVFLTKWRYPAMPKPKQVMNKLKVVLKHMVSTIALVCDGWRERKGG